MSAQPPRLRAPRPVHVTHTPRPDPTRRAQLGDLLEEVVVHVEEERQARREVVHVEATRDTALDVLEPVTQGECEFLSRGGPGLADVVTRDRDRVVVRRILAAPLEHVDDASQSRLWREDPGVLGLVLLEDVVLDSAAQNLRGDALFLSSSDVEAEEDDLRLSWGVPIDKKLILMPGRLTSWKGQEIFIEALNLVNQELKNQNFNAVILGSDQGRNVYKKKLLRLVEQYRLTGQVKFIDHCKNMPIAYKISDLVVSASIEPEAFGRVSVEAQSMEKPIIASNIGGSNETVINDKTGFLFEAGKSTELSKKIIEVLQLDETTLKSLGNEGRKNVIKKFNIEKMCNSTYAEYKKLIN